MSSPLPSLLTVFKDGAAGLDVCLYCFNGGCCTERHHSNLHHHKTKHPLVLNIQRTRKKINVGLSHLQPHCGLLHFHATLIDFLFSGTNHHKRYQS